MQISGAKVLLTGASGGLGAAIARELVRGGAHVVLSGRNVELLSTLAAELGDASSVAPCDLADPEQLAALASANADVDILISNAGVPASGLLDSFSAEQIDRVVAANLAAPIHLTHAVLPHMLERGRGHLVYISSLSGKVASPGAAMYAATKFGLRGFSFGLRQDLEGTGVSASVVSPGFIRDAGMFAKSGAEGSLPAGVGTSSPQEVADAVTSAITRDRFEVTVAPLAMRIGTTFGAALPRVAAAAQRASNAKVLAGRVADGQATYRV